MLLWSSDGSVFCLDKLRYNAVTMRFSWPVPYWTGLFQKRRTVINYREIQKNSLRFLIGAFIALIFCRVLLVSITINSGFNVSYRDGPVSVAASVLLAAQQGAYLFESLLTPLAVLWLAATMACLHQQRSKAGLEREDNTCGGDV